MAKKIGIIVSLLSLMKAMTKQIPNTYRNAAPGILRPFQARRSRYSAEYRRGQNMAKLFSHRGNRLLHL